MWNAHFYAIHIIRNVLTYMWNHIPENCGCALRQIPKLNIISIFFPL